MVPARATFKGRAGLIDASGQVYLRLHGDFDADVSAMTDHQRGLPADRIPVLRVPATPAHTNLGGDIFGGWIMSQVDIAGSIPAVLRAKGRVVTVAVNEMTFLKPVFVGDILSLYADVTEVGHSSLKVGIEVYAQRNPVAPECMKISDATLTYVAIDDKGRPRPVEAAN